MSGIKLAGCGLGRLRKPLEKFRPPSTTELLLSNDGDRLLEGCVTNFFVVCRRVQRKVLTLFLMFCLKETYDLMSHCRSHHLAVFTVRVWESMKCRLHL